MAYDFDHASTCNSIVILNKFIDSSYKLDSQFNIFISNLVPFLMI